MVAFLFLFMVALEKMWERMENYYHAHFSKRPEQVIIHRIQMTQHICFRRVMALAIISYLKGSNRSTRCDVILYARYNSANHDAGIRGGPRPPTGERLCNSGRLRSPLRFGSYFPFMSRNYMTSGLFSWCKFFLVAHSFIFSPCSKSVRPIKAAQLKQSYRGTIMYILTSGRNR